LWWIKYKPLPNWSFCVQILQNIPSMACQFYQCFDVSLNVQCQYTHFSLNMCVKIIWKKSLIVCFNKNEIKWTYIQVLFREISKLFASDSLIRNQKGRMVVPSDLEAGLHLGPLSVDGLKLVQLIREAVVVATLASDENCCSTCVLAIFCRWLIIK